MSARITARGAVAREAQLYVDGDHIGNADEVNYEASLRERVNSTLRLMTRDGARYGEMLRAVAPAQGNRRQRRAAAARLRSRVLAGGGK